MREVWCFRSCKNKWITHRFVGNGVYRDLQNPSRVDRSSRDISTKARRGFRFLFSNRGLAIPIR